MQQASPAPSQSKICIRCGQDCSSRPRTKDQHGRYTCRECLDKAQKQAAAPPHAMRPPSSPSPPSPIAAQADDGVIPLEGDAGAGGDVMALMLADAVKEQAKVTVSPCPGCGNPLRSDTAICVNCGYNTRTGKALNTKEGKPVEAKPQISEKSRGRERDRELAAAAYKMEYVKPVIMTVLGLGVTGALLNSADGGGPDAILGYAILFAISVTLTVFAYVMCALTWLGSDAPLHLAIMRLVGICAVMDILLIGIFSHVPLGGIGGIGFRWILPLLIYAMFLQHIMEIEWEEALMVGVITGIVKVVGTIMIWYWVVTTFGS